MAETETDNTDQNQRRNTVRGMTLEQVSVLKQGGGAAECIYWEFYERFEKSIESHIKFDRASKRRVGHRVLSDLDIQILTEEILDKLRDKAINGVLHEVLLGGEADQSVKVIGDPYLNHRIIDYQDNIKFKRTSTTRIGTGSGAEEDEAEINPESPRQNTLEESLGFVPIADRTFPFPFAETGLKNREHKLFTMIQWKRIEWDSAQDKTSATTELSEWLGISEVEVDRRIQAAHKNEEINRDQRLKELAEERKRLDDEGSNARKKYQKIDKQEEDLVFESVLCPLGKKALGSIFAENPSSNTLDRYMKAYRDFRDQDGFLNELLRQDADDLS